MSTNHMLHWVKPIHLSYSSGRQSVIVTGAVHIDRASRAHCTQTHNCIELVDKSNSYKCHGLPFEAISI